MRDSTRRHSYCLSLTGIELPYSLTAIGMGAFSDCPLKSVKLPKKWQKGK